MFLKQRLTAHVKTDAKSIKLVKKYVRRKLVRPRTTWCVPVLIGALMLIVPFFVAYALLYFFTPFLPVWCYVICYLVIDVILFRLLLIKIVRCYQHYAREEIRRFCMCMPSCSEYAIAVLKKYPLAIAIFKIIFRLKVTCNGEMKIDMP